MRSAPLLIMLVSSGWLLTAAVPSSTAEPNPFGPASSETTVVLRPDGSYDVRLRQQQNLVREFRFRFGGAVHDGFRLADDNRLPPAYLRAAYALTSATAGPAGPVPPSFIRTNHRWAAESPGQVYPAGDHEVTLDYRVTGASRPVRAGWAVHLRLLDINYEVDDVVTIDARAVRPTSLVLRCVSYPPDTVPCGSGSGPRLTYTLTNRRSNGVPPEFVILVEADNASVRKPATDRS